MERRASNSLTQDFKNFRTHCSQLEEIKTTFMANSLESGPLVPHGKLLVAGKYTARPAAAPAMGGGLTNTSTMHGDTFW